MNPRNPRNLMFLLLTGTNSGCGQPTLLPHAAQQLRSHGAAASAAWVSCIAET